MHHPIGVLKSGSVSQRLQLTELKSVIGSVERPIFNYSFSTRNKHVVYLST